MNLGQLNIGYGITTTLNIKYVYWLICFFWEYIYSRIGRDNIKYIDEDDIGKHVDYIFEDILPDYYFNP